MNDKASVWVKFLKARLSKRRKRVWMVSLLLVLLDFGKECSSVVIVLGVVLGLIVVMVGMLGWLDVWIGDISAASAYHVFFSIAKDQHATVFSHYTIIDGTDNGISNSIQILMFIFIRCFVNLICFLNSYHWTDSVVAIWCWISNAVFSVSSYYKIRNFSGVLG